MNVVNDSGNWFPTSTVVYLTLTRVIFKTGDVFLFFANKLVINYNKNKLLIIESDRVLNERCNFSS